MWGGESVNKSAREENKGTELEDENRFLRLEKGRRGLVHVVFGRTAIIVLLLLVQLVLLLCFFNYLEHYIPYVFGGYVLFGLVVVVLMLDQTETTSAQLTWAILIMAVPVIGSCMYLFTRLEMGNRLLAGRLRELISTTGSYIKQDKETIRQLETYDPGAAQLATYLMRHGNFPVYGNSGIQYFPLGENKFDEVLLQLQKAEHFIFLEYFIIEEGYMWGRVLEILEQKAKQGVEVRVLYDGTCAINHLPYGYPKALQALGIKCKMFSPIRPVVSTSYNYRDHRKILVIDGHTAFTGGINFADEYINRKKRFGHWKDTAIMVQGAAARSFTLMFLQMWNITEKHEDWHRYIDVKLPERPQERGFVIPYGDSPLDKERVGEMVYIDILNRAKRYVHVMTPYLILDGELQTAIRFAAKRGVEVAIILPHIPDKKTAFALAKNHYRELIEAGVQIYEYTPGFVHAKVVVSDDEKAVVGTINFDYRSLYHHFECAALLYDVPEIADIERDVTKTLEQCRRILREDCRKISLPMKLLGKVLRLVAPLM